MKIPFSQFEVSCTDCQCLRILHLAISTSSCSRHQGEAVGLWRLLTVQCGVCSGQESGSLIPVFRGAPVLIELYKYHNSRNNQEKKLNFKMYLPTELSLLTLVLLAFMQSLAGLCGLEGLSFQCGCVRVWAEVTLCLRELLFRCIVCIALRPRDNWPGKWKIQMSIYVYL